MRMDTRRKLTCRSSKNSSHEEEECITEDERAELITLVRDREMLWNEGNQEYKNYAARCHAWEDIISIFRARGSSFDVTFMQRQWKSMRDIFVKKHRELRDLLRLCDGGVDSRIRKITNWPHWDGMLFLTRSPSYAFDSTVEKAYELAGIEMPVIPACQTPARPYWLHKRIKNEIKAEVKREAGLDDNLPMGNISLVEMWTRDAEKAQNGAENIANYLETSELNVGEDTSINSNGKRTRPRKSNAGYKKRTKILPEQDVLGNVLLQHLAGLGNVNTSENASPLDETENSEHTNVMRPDGGEMGSISLLRSIDEFDALGVVVASRLREISSLSEVEGDEFRFRLDEMITGISRRTLELKRKAPNDNQSTSMENLSISTENQSISVENQSISIENQSIPAENILAMENVLEDAST